MQTTNFETSSDKNTPWVDLLCRLGIYGNVGRIRPKGSASRIQRGDQVLCRTARGVEVGEVLNVCERSGVDPDGSFLRRMTPEDHLLWKQLQAHSQAAMFSCQKWLDENQRTEVLLDVEPLMDGKTLYFHFAGPPTDSLSEQLDRMVEVYQESVAESEFAKLLEHGCGPGCGTEEKSACGTAQGCAVCVAASVCKK